MLKTLILCLCLPLMLCSAEDQAKSFNYDTAFDEIISETDKGWDEILKMMKDEGDGADALKMERASKDAYLQVLKLVKQSKDQQVKNAMIIYQYKYFISAYAEELRYADSVVARLKASKRITDYKNKLKEFEARLKPEPKGKDEEKSKDKIDQEKK